MMSSVLLTEIKKETNDDSNRAKNIMDKIPYEAVALMGHGDTFDEGIHKFIRSFIPVSNWYDRESSVKSLVTNEPGPYTGTFSFVLTIDKIEFRVQGNFKVVHYLSI